MKRFSYCSGSQLRLNINKNFMFLTSLDLGWGLNMVFVFHFPSDSMCSLLGGTASLWFPNWLGISSGSGATHLFPWVLPDPKNLVIAFFFFSG